MTDPIDPRLEEALAAMEQRLRDKYDAEIDQYLSARAPGLTSAQLVQVYRQVISGAHLSWVVYARGTCVILGEPAADLAAQATDLLRRYGPTGAGGPGGDFSVSRLTNDPGFLVGGHHADILVYVSPADVPEVGAVPDQAGEVEIGYLGLARRHQDGRELRVVHVEDKRLGPGGNAGTAN